MHKLPVVVIAGRPNVGKSLLFNRLCGKRASIVHEAPGMTLDYLAETALLAPGCAVEFIDTGGVRGEENDWSEDAARRMEKAAEFADVFLLLADARAGLRHGDELALAMLRRRWPKTPRLLLANKSEGMSEAEACTDFYALGEEIMPVSAKRGGGLAALRQKLAEMLPAATESQNAAPLAIIGRPNVGKSTLLNRLLKEDRALVSPRPGTTRDNICAVLSSRRGEFLLIDTAGMRRRRETADQNLLSVSAARAAVARASAVFLVWDMSEGALYQDKRLAALAAAAGCGAVLVGNKSDLLPAAHRKQALSRQVRELSLGFEARSFAVSAAAGKLPETGMLEAARRAAAAGRVQFPTAQLNRALSEAVRRNPPPMSGGTRPKLRYIHQGGRAPLRFIIHGGAVSRIAEDYRRYLASFLARRLSVVGAPLRLDFRAEENPYVG
ncbi:MAG: ribosome biogenesis GTPase Der [Betaproteobacteria bacterium]|nr:ribosome biogenesis GTPase Der [Betaproteobacteria bacterium]